MYTEPKYCPFNCGETLIVKKVTSQIFLDTLPLNADLDTVFGFLCQKCGYATTIFSFKKCNHDWQSPKERNRTDEEWKCKKCQLVCSIYTKNCQCGNHKK